MANITVSAVLDYPAAEVWGIVRDFGGIAKWVPGIVSVSTEGSGVGMIRTITQKDKARFVAKLVSLDEQARTCEYETLETSLPLESLRSRLKVIHKGAHTCVVEWTSTFRARENEEQERQWLERAYKANLDSLRTLCAHQHIPLPVTLLVSLKAKPKLVENLKQVLTDLAKASREESGCVAYHMHQSLDDPTQFMLYMQWKDVEAFDRHVQSQLVMQFDARQADELLAEPYVMTRWRVLE